MATHTDLNINGITIKIDTNETILDAVRKSSENIDIETPCNGRGTCGKCRIFITSGSVNAPAAEEKKFLSKADLEKGARLACFAKAAPPFEPIIATIPDTNQNMHKPLTSGDLPAYCLNPVIRKQCFSFATAASSRSLIERFETVTSLKIKSGCLDLYKQIEALKDEETVTAVLYQDELIGIESGDTTDRICGIAVDIGTTTIACSLVDLNSGCILAEASSVNPQTKYGGDVLSRIEYTMREHEGLKRLQSLVVSCLNGLTDEMTGTAHIDSQNIYGYTITANTTMLHLLMGVNPVSIALAPYTPLFTGSQIVPARQIGLTQCAGFARLSSLPAVSAYVGADISAGVLVSNIAKTKQNVMFIDIGTNGEIVFSQKGNMISCSCAAGPALEGMNISCGMRASNGAIEEVDFSDGDFHVKTIGGEEPVGLCGSGVLDALAVLLNEGGVDETGRIAKVVPEHLSRYFIKDGKKQAYVLSYTHNRIIFSQHDVRQVQLAKGAILSGFMALLQEYSLKPEDIDQVIIAGQFGKHLNESSLIRTGLLPPEVKGKIIYIGNSSLTGAILCLLDRSKNEEIEKLAKEIAYLELALLPEYSRLFIDCMAFPEE